MAVVVLRYISLTRPLTTRSASSVPPFQGHAFAPATRTSTSTHLYTVICGGTRGGGYTYGFESSELERSDCFFVVVLQENKKGPKSVTEICKQDTQQTHRHHHHRLTNVMMAFRILIFENRKRKLKFIEYA